MATTETKHTPGPWHIIHEPTLNTYHIRVEDLDAVPVASLFYSSGGCRPQFSRELIDANARLISAAPDLLAACELRRMLDQFVESDVLDRVLKHEIERRCRALGWKGEEWCLFADFIRDLAERAIAKATA